MITSLCNTDYKYKIAAYTRTGFTSTFRIALTAICLQAFLSLSLRGQTFENVTDINGIDVYTFTSEFGNGVSFADFNQDGWDDLSFATKYNEPVFYLNNEGSYELIEFDTLNPESGDIKAIQWVNYDNDNDLDLFLTFNHQPVKLYENIGDLELMDVTSEAGLVEEYVRHYGASWADYNKDGYLDLYICKYHNPIFSEGYQFTNHLYRNDGNGTFTDVTEYAGVGDGIKASFQSLFFDYDGDGWEDLYVINDRINMANSMYRNNGDGTFSNTTLATNTGISIDAMTITAGDFDRDQDVDIYITDNYVNVLFQNNGDGTFSDIASEVEVEVNEISWGAIWIDYDNNQLEDLHVACQSSIGTINEQNFFFRNEITSFTPIHNEINLQDDDYGTHALAMGDIDNNGYPDFVENNMTTASCQLWQNTGGENNWLKVSVEGVVSNKDGIGTLIRAYTDDIVQTRQTNLGECYLAQNSKYEMFGLAGYSTVDSLIVKWPSGVVDRFYDISANQTFHVVEGQSLTNEIQVNSELSLCPGDSIILTAEIADSYEWSTGHSGQFLTVDQPGAYFVSLTEDGLTTNSDTVQVVSLPPPAVVSQAQDASCYGEADGFVIVENYNGNGIMSVNWENGAEGDTLYGLQAGFYEFTLTDLNGCSASGIVEIEQPDSLEIQVSATDQEIDNNGTAEVSIEGGTLPYNIEWSTGQEDLIQIGNLLPGDYSILITDANGCEKETYFSIGKYTFVDDLPEIFDITIYPNPVNEQLFIEGATLNYRVSVYNLYGSLIRKYPLQKSGSESNLSLNVSSYASGAYILHLSDGLNSKRIPFVKR